MKKLIWPGVLCLCLVILFIPTIVRAEEGYDYLDEKGATRNTGETVVTEVSAADPLAVLTDGWYIVQGKFSIDERDRKSVV